MNRTTWLQDRRMQKFRDVLSRWERRELSAMEAGEVLGMSERQFRPAAILVQHHAHAWLPRPLAPMRAPPLRSLDQACRMQLRLRPGVAPTKPVLLDAANVG